MPVRLSILDLAPTGRGETASDSFAASVALAQQAEQLGVDQPPPPRRRVADLGDVVVDAEARRAGSAPSRRVTAPGISRARAIVTS